MTELAADAEACLWRAGELGAAVQGTTSPNPWVGCVIVAADGTVYEGATQPPGGPHAEAVALAAAGPAAAGATAYVTLEPCSHHGRTPPCADALVAAGVRRVVVAQADPDPLVAGAGLARLREGGIDVVEAEGPAADAARAGLAAYRKHRATGRPWVVLKLATTLDGRTAAPDGSSQWITGEAARADVHRLRAASDAVVVGAGTVRADDPALTVRGIEAPGGDPRRVVLGKAPNGAKVLPALEWVGELEGLLDRLGAEGVLQVLVEGGAHVAHDFHAQGLVDRYVLYLAPVVMGGDDGTAAFAGPGAATLTAAWRGEIVAVERLGADLRVDLAPTPRPPPAANVL